MAEATPALSLLAENKSWPKSNYSGDSGRQHTTKDGIIYIINTFICLYGLIGNGIVLHSLRFYLKKNPFIVYILNLAVADFAFLLSCLFIVLVFIVECFGSYKFPYEKLMIGVYKTELSLYSCSMYFLTTISTERCFCVLYPFRYRCRRPAWLPYAVSAVLWSIVFLLWVVDVCSLWEKEPCQSMERAIAIANLSFFTPVMIMSSLRLLLEVRRLSQYKPNNLCKTILLSVLFFIIFAVPLSVRRIVTMNFPNIFYLLASLNSSINPAIYFLVGVSRNKGLREPLRSIFHRALDEKEEGNVCAAEMGRTCSQVRKPMVSTTVA